jgi:hypothetical protein
MMLTRSDDASYPLVTFLFIYYIFYNLNLGFFLLAEETEPLFYDRNQLMIGVCYHRLNQQELALEHFTKVKYWIKANHESDAYDEAIAYIEQLIK